MIRLIAMALLTAFSTLTCAAPANAIKDDNAAVDAVAKATINYKLTPLSIKCLYFDTDDQGKDYFVRVWEKHDKKCGGDPETAPTVFFMKVRKSDGHLTTNAYHPENPDFQELKPAPGARIKARSP